MKVEIIDNPITTLTPAAQPAPVEPINPPVIPPSKPTLTFSAVSHNGRIINNLNIPSDDPKLVCQLSREMTRDHQALYLDFQKKDIEQLIPLEAKRASNTAWMVFSMFATAGLFLIFLKLLSIYWRAF
jgi:hypothetical protein